MPRPFHGAVYVQYPGFQRVVLLQDPTLFCLVPLLRALYGLVSYPVPRGTIDQFWPHATPIINVVTGLNHMYPLSVAA